MFSRLARRVAPQKQAPLCDAMRKTFATHLPDSLIAGVEQTSPVQPIPQELYHHSKREQDKLMKQMPEHAREAVVADQHRMVAEVFDADAVGDKVIAMHKRMRTTARETYLFDGHASHNDLNRSTRASPIWWTPKTPSDRLPRAPMPADLGISTSPTVGLLYAYRLHHARMYIESVKRQRLANIFRGYADLDKVDLSMPDIEGANNAEIQNILHTYKEAFRRFPGISLKEKQMLLMDLKALLPKVVKIHKEEVVKKKKRKK